MKTICQFIFCCSIFCCAFSAIAQKSKPSEVLVLVQDTTTGQLIPTWQDTITGINTVAIPLAQFMGKSGVAKISRSDLIKGNSISALINAGEFAFPVVSFNISITLDNVLIEEMNNAATLNHKQKTLLNKARAGDIVKIDKIKVKNPNGEIIAIESITLHVTD